MKSLFVLLGLACILAQVLGDEIQQNFDKFLKRHGRKYKTKAEEARRRAHFVRNHKQIEELNASAKKAGHNVTFGVNKFADKSVEEFRARLSKIGPGNHSSLPLFKPKHGIKFRTKREIEVPDNFDLRDISVNGDSIVGPVKDQEECGCCWAFATTSVTETVNAIHKKRFTSLSDQEISDCAITGDTPGCIGGDPRNGLQFVSYYGQTHDYDYPFDEWRSNTTGHCDYKGKPTVIEPDTLQVYRFDPDSAVDDIIENMYFNHIPTAVYFKIGSKFEWYTGGVLQVQDCLETDEADWHSAAIIGYGTDDNGVDYWTIRNSWASDWGEDGYVRVVRGIDWCEIESHPATAIIQD